MASHQQYDVIIVGGGMVGATMACALSQLALRIALIEAHEPQLDREDDSFDLRVSAITPASENIFRSLHVWDSMRQQRVTPYYEMHVWDSRGKGQIHFDSADVGEPELGHIVENRVIQAALWQQCRQQSNITLLCPREITALTLTRDTASVTLADGEVLDAALLIAADGGQSRMREFAGIKLQGWSYDQKAVVATIKTGKSHRDTAWQRFLPTGPIAFLPLTAEYSSIVWTTTPQEADILLALPEYEFLSALHLAFGDSLGDMLDVMGERAAFPLRLAHAHDYVKPCFALIGDAAHTVHPLAGQGVNLGLADAATLADTIRQALENKESFGSFKVLRRYERARKGDNLAMLAAMDGFNRLFGSDIAAVEWLRNTGLSLTNNLLPVKNLLIRHAMGISGEVPSLAKPPLRTIL